MTQDTLAARLRAAYHADMPGEAVPFDELKPCVCDRWQRVADAARVPAEVPTPTRVPFSDETIERMAKAHMGMVSPGSNWEHADKQYYMNAIRAALAAGGLEPCAPPEYDPADVALAPADELWRTPLEMKSISGFHRLAMLYPEDDQFLVSLGSERAAMSPADAARMAAWLSSYAAAHGVPAAPTGHVLRDRLVEAERKVENQRAELNRLNTLVADLRAQLAREPEWVRQYKQDRDDALAELEAVKVERDNLKAQLLAPPVGDHPHSDADAIAACAVAELEANGIAGLTTHMAVRRVVAITMEATKVERDALRERTAVPVKVVPRWTVTAEQVAENRGITGGGAADMCQGFMDYLAAHAVIDAPAGVGQDLAPSADEVEALARVLCETYTSKTAPNRWGDVARAAIAHLRQRPDELPTRDQMAQIIYKAGWCKSYVWDDNDGGAERNQIYAEADAILTALAPWLRDPVGWKLDVTAEELSDILLPVHRQSVTVMQATRTVLDLCRSRIRPAAHRAYTDADVEKLAKLMCGAAHEEFGFEDWEGTAYQDAYRLAARAALDWMGAPVGECKECAEKEAELRRHNDKWTGFIQRCQADAQNARAALEGE